MHSTRDANGKHGRPASDFAAGTGSCIWLILPRSTSLHRNPSTSHSRIGEGGSTATWYKARH